MSNLAKVIGLEAKNIGSEDRIMNLISNDLVEYKSLFRKSADFNSKARKEYNITKSSLNAYIAKKQFPQKESIVRLYAFISNVSLEDYDPRDIPEEVKKFYNIQEVEYKDLTSFFRSNSLLLELYLVLSTGAYLNQLEVRSKYGIYGEGFLEKLISEGLAFEFSKGHYKLGRVAPKENAEFIKLVNDFILNNSLDLEKSTDGSNEEVAFMQNISIKKDDLVEYVKDLRDLYRKIECKYKCDGKEKDCISIAIGYQHSKIG